MTKNTIAMMWEALTAVASVITSVVLIATVIMARHQLHLLRRSTQLDGLIRILAEMDDPAYVASYRFVLDELPGKMEDPMFRQRIIDGETDESTHLYLPILFFFEKVGSFVKFELIDPDAVYCQAGSRCVRVWNALQEVVAYDRARGGPGVWDGIEALAKGTVPYYRQMNPNFPRLTILMLALMQFNSRSGFTQSIVGELLWKESKESSSKLDRNRGLSKRGPSPQIALPIVSTIGRAAV